MPTYAHIAKRAVAAALAICLFFPAHAFSAEPESPDLPRYRALLIACDSFVYAAEMTPTGRNNIELMEKILGQDLRGFEIMRQYNITNSKEALAFAIEAAFANAKANDVSLLYFSTHGQFTTEYNNPEGILLLSDGAVEDSVSAQELNAMLDKIAGTKLLLVDACNSGALIGKGVSPSIGSARVAKMFQSDEYKVLTSSGASEPSWYWATSTDGLPPGISFFTTALAMGAGLLGVYAADANRDGIVTLAEMYSYLWTNHASSAVQLYPQDDSYPLFVYDRPLTAPEAHGELTGFVFPSTSLDAENPELTFSYSATVHSRVVYQITYFENGQWNWNSSIVKPDVTEFDGDADPMGDISPGRKQITLNLKDDLPEGWTYAMIHVMTVAGFKAEREPFIYAARVLSARHPQINPQLQVRASANWNSAVKKELEIFVRHAVPCNLTVKIETEGGKSVRRLSISRPTRPQALQPDGSLLYWNGHDDGGQSVAPGRYRIEAQTRMGGTLHTAEVWVTVE